MPQYFSGGNTKQLFCCPVPCQDLSGLLLQDDCLMNRFNKCSVQFFFFLQCIISPLSVSNIPDSTDEHLEGTVRVSYRCCSDECVNHRSISLLQQRWIFPDIAFPFNEMI